METWLKVGSHSRQTLIQTLIPLIAWRRMLSTRLRFMDVRAITSLPRMAPESVALSMNSQMIGDIPPGPLSALTSLTYIKGWKFFNKVSDLNAIGPANVWISAMKACIRSTMLSSNGL